MPINTRAKYSRSNFSIDSSAANSRAGVYEYSLRSAVFVLIPITAVFEVATLHGLYADGANFLVHILAGRGFYFLNASRRFTEILTQLPVVLAVKIGLTELPLLILIHSAVLILMPAIAWVLCLWRLYKDDLFWPMFVLFCLIHFNFDFFAVGEYNIAYALVALSIAILSATAEVTILWAAVALVSAVCLITSYEALVFLGPLLAVLAFQQVVAKRQLQSFTVRSMIVLCLACYLCAAIIAGLSILHPRDPLSYASAANLRFAVQNSLLLLSVGFAFAYWLSFSASPLTRRLAGMVAICSLLLLAWPGFWSVPDMQYFSRTLGGIVVLMFGAIVLLRSPINHWMHIDLTKVGPANGYCALSFFCFLLISDVTRSIQFTEYLNDFRKEVRTHTGLIAFEATDLKSHYDNVYGWWTHPTLSVLLRDNVHQAVVLNSSKWNFFQPFDPRTALPDLSIYYHER